MTSSRGDDKRPIDRVRESTLSMQIGGADDGAISVMIDMGTALYGVKEHAIYAVQLPGPSRPGTDQCRRPEHAATASIDRHSRSRSRSHLPDCVFKSMHLGASFPERKSWYLAFEFLRDIVTMMEIHSALVKTIEEAVAGFNAVVTKDRRISLPSLGNSRKPATPSPRKSDMLSIP